MIDLPLKKEEKPKICTECGIAVNDKNGIRYDGYLVRMCKKCRRKIHNEKNKIKRKRNKMFKEWYG